MPRFTIVCGSLLVALVGLAAQPAPPLPAVAWRAELPTDARLDEVILWDSTTLPALAGDPALASVRLLPSAINAQFASRCRPTWTLGPTGPGAVPCSAFLPPRAGRHGSRRGAACRAR